MCRDFYPVKRQGRVEVLGLQMKKKGDGSVEKNDGEKVKKKEKNEKNKDNNDDKDDDTDDKEGSPPDEELQKETKRRWWEFNKKSGE